MLYKFLTDVKPKFIAISRLLLAIFLYLTVFSLYYQIWHIPGELFLRADVTSFTVGGKIVHDFGGNLLYDINLQKELFYEVVQKSPDEIMFFPFRHPPFFAYFFSYISSTPIALIYKLVVLTNFFLFLVLVYIVSRKFKWPRKYLFYSSFFLLLTPVLSSIWSGQVSIILALIFFGTYLLLDKKKYFFAGAASSLIWLKPQMLLIVPFIFLYLKAKKRRDYLIGFILCFLSILLINLLITKDFVIIYINFLTKTETPQLGSLISSIPTLDKFILKFAEDFGLIIHTNIRLVLNLILYSFFVILFSIKANGVKLNLKRVYSAAIMLTIPFSVHFITHDKVLLLIPFFLLFDDYVKTKRRESLFIGMSIIILSNIKFRFLFGSAFVLMAALLILPFFLLRNSNSFTTSKLDKNLKFREN